MRNKVMLSLGVIGCIGWMFLFAFVADFAKRMPGNPWWLFPVVALTFLSALAPGALCVVYGANVMGGKKREQP